MTHKETGDLEKAEATIDRMVEVFEQKQLKPYILQQITADAEAEKAVLKQA
jgi:hypothetical protein